jgi:hypothetical protein
MYVSMLTGPCPKEEEKVEAGIHTCMHSIDGMKALGVETATYTYISPK